MTEAPTVPFKAIWKEIEVWHRFVKVIEDGPVWQKMIPIRRERQLGWYALVIAIVQPVLSSWSVRRLAKKDSSRTWYIVHLGRLRLSWGG